MATTKVAHDFAWSADTAANLRAADDALGRVVASFRGDNDDEAARTAVDVGGVVLCCVAALCSSIADLATAVRESGPTVL